MAKTLVSLSVSLLQFSIEMKMHYVSNEIVNI